MAISLEILGLKINEETKSFDFNGQTIEVKQYLSINQKLELISWIINQSADDLKFYNVGKLNIFEHIGLVKYYTNIEITEEELEDPAYLYDLLFSSGLINKIKEIIPEKEYLWVNSVLNNTVDSIYKYNNSIMGVLDVISTDYSNLNFDVEELQKNLSNPENLKLLKDVVTKLG